MNFELNDWRLKLEPGYLFRIYNNDTVYKFHKYIINCEYVICYIYDDPMAAQKYINCKELKDRVYIG